MKKEIASLFILLFFIIALVLPFTEYSPIIELANDSQYNKMILGVLHLPSLLFIVSSFILLWTTVSRKNKKYADYLHKTIVTEFKHTSKILKVDNYTIDDLKKIFDHYKSNIVLRELKQILIFGGNEKDMELNINKFTNVIYYTYEKLKNDYNYIATILPMLGMAGTIAGLLQMFAMPSNIDDFASKFAGLSIALATTLYASLITVLWVKPSAREVENQITDVEQNEEEIILHCKLFLHNLDMQVFYQYLEESQSRDALGSKSMPLKKDSIKV